MSSQGSWLQRLTDRVVTVLRRVRLQPRLFICFLGVSLLPVVLYGAYAYHVYNHSIRTKVGEYAEQSAKLLNRNLQWELEKYGYYINSLSVMDEVQQLMCNEGDGNQDLTGQIHQLNQELKSAASAGPYLRETQIVSLDGALLYSSGYENASNTAYKDLLPQIDKVSPQDSLQYAVSRHTESGNLVIGRKIYQYSVSMEPIGYILIYINARPLSEALFNGIDFGPDSVVFLMSQDGTILISNNEAYTSGQTLAQDSFYTRLTAQDTTNSVMLDVREGNSAYLAAYNYNPTYQCYFVVTVPESYIRNETRATMASLFVLAVVLFGASFTVTLLVYFSIVKPLRRIVDCCNILSDEELDKTIGDESPDEVGFLARTLDNLIRELKQMARQWQKDQARKRELELESLRYQINPHFLFNTLNSLQWLATLNDVPVLSEGIGSLSALLKSTLIQKDEFLPLEEEVRNLSHYFSIQKIRYGDTFDIHFEIEPSLLSYCVPRFILQPLAENAVLHGMKEAQILQITILAQSLPDDCVRIGVLDDGKGFSIGGSKDQKEHFFGIGLSNVAERLRLYYGDGYGLTVESEPGQGTCCWIRLPAVDARIDTLAPGPDEKKGVDDRV